MWDPDQYLMFDDHRSRPFDELVARIRVESPRRVVDIGCGPAHLTQTLAKRWPGARLEAFDSSPEMVAAARDRGIAAEVRDVRDWIPAPDTDVAVCNAVLQWVPDHGPLLRAWVDALPAGAWLAFQVPGNFDAPSHAQVRALAGTPEWRSHLADLPLRPEDAVLDPSGYAALLAAAGCAVDAWETTYLHRLTGADAVLEWIAGTALRPIRSALSEDAWTRFRAALAPLLRDAYPQRPDGTTWFPFRRVFAVARVPA
ncbi:MAG TPA: trans-aconitate 2-methyltransferase [Actinophytocola sp.]|uniref:trans-aconitate 2-methyltransferase n=1 Tax=Actinophytocola sp. TaxID=1872138 RepID=UPI002DBE7052|nr:trans-aconitate 2-methyltransferase [Actinophytocola sp.]HEU5474387.1 trans-aconitate 2-methyltransferase [Actinophytocola sp.]